MEVAQVVPNLDHREDAHILEVTRDANIVGLALTLMEIAEDLRVVQEAVVTREVAPGAVIAEDLEKATIELVVVVVCTMTVALITSPDSIQTSEEEDADRTVILETIAISEAEAVMIGLLIGQGPEEMETDILIDIVMTTDHIADTLEVVHLV